MSKAIWVIAHGSSKAEWIKMLDQQIAKINSSLPIMLSFLEKVEGRLITDGIAQLKLLGITDVLVIPLFVSSGSTHIQEIKTILLTYKDIFKFTFANTMDDHDLVVKHITEQASILSKDPDNEQLLLIGHGSDEPEFIQKWNNVLNKLEVKLRNNTKYQRVHTATFLPYTIEEMFELTKMEDLTTLVIPLFLSNGIFTDRRIPRAIEGYKAKYSGESYINADWIHTWIEAQIISFQ